MKAMDMSHGEGDALSRSTGKGGQKFLSTAAGHEVCHQCYPAERKLLEASDMKRVNLLAWGFGKRKAEHVERSPECFASAAEASGGRTLSGTGMQEAVKQKSEMSLTPLSQKMNMEPTEWCKWKKYQPSVFVILSINNIKIYGFLFLLFFPLIGYSKAPKSDPLRAHQSTQEIALPSGHYALSTVDYKGTLSVCDRSSFLVSHGAIKGVKKYDVKSRQWKQVTHDRLDDAIGCLHDSELVVFKKNGEKDSDRLFVIKVNSGEKESGGRLLANNASGNIFVSSGANKLLITDVDEFRLVITNSTGKVERVAKTATGKVTAATWCNNSTAYIFGEANQNKWLEESVVNKTKVTTRRISLSDDYVYTKSTCVESGEYVVFQGYDRDDHSHLFLYSLANNSVSIFSKGVQDFFILGETVYFSNEENCCEDIKLDHLWAADLENKTLKRVAFPFDLRRVINIVAPVNGSYIAFLYKKDDSGKIIVLVKTNQGDQHGRLQPR